MLIFKVLLVFIAVTLADCLPVAFIQNGILSQKLFYQTWKKTPHNSDMRIDVYVNIHY